MGHHGKKRIIYRVVKAPWKNEDGNWLRSIELVCGHVVTQKLRGGPSKGKADKFAFCLACAVEEVK